jgi:catechol 2,3-dioxygenase-like lactoylglutathione lyase family enzyme
MATLDILDLSHIVLSVSDMDQSADFYSNVLGLSTLFSMELPNGAGLSRGYTTPAGIAVELVQIHGVDAVEAAASSTLAFSVPDLAAAKSSLESAGIAITMEMDIAGIAMLFIQDPDGHAIEIAQLPGAHTRSAQLHA